MKTISEFIAWLRDTNPMQNKKSYAGVVYETRECCTGDEIYAMYAVLSRHAPLHAERLCDAIASAEEDMELKSRLFDKRCAEYDASLWKRLTSKKWSVLSRLYESADRALIRRYICENDLSDAVEAIERESIERKEAEVDAGNFVYYVVAEGTNVRAMHDGMPIICVSRNDAEYDCDGADFMFSAVISVAAYNRIYEQFMPQEP